MYTLTFTTSSTSIRPIFKPKASLPNTQNRRTNLTPPKPMEANQNDNSLRRRDLLALGAAAAASAACPPPIAAAAAADYPIKLDGVVSRVVARPRKSRSKAEKEEEEEVLVIGGIEFDRGLPIKFDVYVNDDDIGDSPRGGADTAEFAGSMVNVPHGQGRGKSNIMRTCLRLGISDLLENVGADDDDSVVVTLVPKSGVGLITISSIGIELLG